MQIFSHRKFGSSKTTFDHAPRKGSTRRPGKTAGWTSEGRFTIFSVLDRPRHTARSALCEQTCTLGNSISSLAPRPVPLPSRRKVGYWECLDCRLPCSSCRGRSASGVGRDEQRIMPLSSVDTIVGSVSYCGCHAVVIRFLGKAVETASRTGLGNNSEPTPNGGRVSYHS